MTFFDELISDLRQEVKDKKNQRKSTLEFLIPLDAYIDKIDELIKKLDSGVPLLLQQVNDGIKEVEIAYQNRVAIGCSSDLSWTLEQSEYPPGYPELASYSIWKVTQDMEVRAQDPLFGLRYYQKPLNRDYGTTIVKEVSGSIKSGSNELAIITPNGIVGIQTGDWVSDDLTSSTAFQTDDLPRVVGFGTTTFNSFTAVVGGRISTGSTVFIHVGIGSTAGLSIGNAFYKEDYTLPNTTIVGFGTTVTTLEVRDYTVGVPFQTSITIVANTILISNPVSYGGTNVEFNVGIVTNTASILLSTSSNDNIETGFFSILRITDNPDDEFDYNKSPINPITIGIITPNNLGIGHSVEIANDGSPQKTRQWDQAEEDNPPGVGVGSLTYSKGTLSWPTLITCNGAEPNYVCTSSYASLGDVAIANTTTSIGTTSISPTGLTPTSPICVAYASSIAEAEAKVIELKDANIPKAQFLIDASMALRRIRDDKELYAWSLLQGAAYLKEDYTRLEAEINALINSGIR